MALSKLKKIKVILKTLYLVRARLVHFNQAKWTMRNKYYFITANANRQALIQYDMISFLFISFYISSFLRSCCCCWWCVVFLVVIIYETLNKLALFFFLFRYCSFHVQKKCAHFCVCVCHVNSTIRPISDGYIPFSALAINWFATFNFRIHISQIQCCTS